MQVKTFTIPIHDEGFFAEYLNRFVRSRCVVEIRREFVSDGAQSCWCFCVHYLDGVSGTAPFERSRRVDYREVLDEATFRKFAGLRLRRKQIADADGLPAYAVFTDEQLAEMAKLESLTLTTMASVKGVGAGKIERYGNRLLDSSTDSPEERNDETKTPGGPAQGTLT